MPRTEDRCSVKGAAVLTRCQVRICLLFTCSCLSADFQSFDDVWEESIGDANAPDVQLASGAVVKGYITQQTNDVAGDVFAYRGIRYATASRFEVPFLWDYPEGEVIDSKRDATKCPQVINGEFLGSEDCLFLDAYVPPKGTKNAVMVWIHGGALVRNSKQKYEARGLINFVSEARILALSINYRLNVFGFFATIEYGEKNNFGIRDCIEALKWVQRNIRRFRGDPNRVTIAGQSAGGLAVMALFQSPLAVGLFRRGICHSPGFMDVSQFQKPSWMGSESMGKACLDAAGCDTLKCLREKEAEEISLKCLQYNDFQSLVTSDDVFAGYDGVVLQQPLYEPFCSGDYIEGDQKPLIVGTTPHEWTYMKGDVGMAAFTPVQRFLSNHLDGFDQADRWLQSCARKKIIQNYGNLRQNCRGCAGFEAPGIMQFATDAEFTVGAQLFASSKTYGNHYRYLFDVEEGQGIWGAGHDSELDYFFLDPDNVPGSDMQMGEGVLKEEKKRLGMQLREYWTTFVKRGTPTSKTGPKWKAVDPGSQGTPFLRFKLSGTSMQTVAYVNSESAKLVEHIACNRAALYRIGRAVMDTECEIRTWNGGAEQHTGRRDAFVALGSVCVTLAVAWGACSFLRHRRAIRASLYARRSSHELELALGTGKTAARVLQSLHSEAPLTSLQRLHPESSS